MLKGSLPPQAYTREVLALAFQWLQTQPDPIRKMAQTPDALVALYLKAKRSGDVSIEQEAPVSAEAFRTHLKTLAHEIQQFLPENEQHKTSQTNTNQIFSQNSAHGFPTQPSMPHQMVNPTPPHFSENFVEDGVGRRPTQSISQSMESRIPDMRNLDARSIEMIHKVKHHLNLSSDTEAMRALLVLGFERFQSLFRS